MVETSSSVAQLAQHSLFERFARGGFVVSGLLHLIIGYIAIRLAMGGQNGEADHSGALAELASKRGGSIAMWAAAIALAAMALWRLVETFLGRSSDPQGKSADVFDRFKAFCLAAVYAGFAFSAFGFARGGGRSSSEQNAGISARLMTSGAGKAALFAAAAIILGVGGYHVYKGVSKKFLEDLQGVPSKLVRRVGISGYFAQGLVIAGAGLLVAIATINSEPEKATGLDGALKSLGAQPLGEVLLIAAGAGIITYGFYCFAMARYMKM